MTDDTVEGIEELAVAARNEVVAMEEELVELSHRIHSLAELAFEEHRSAMLLRDFLRSHGFEVSTETAGMPTGFLAEGRFGTTSGTVAIFCEYDALSAIGHGCGHNIIAAAGVGGGVAAARWLERRPDVGGRLLVVGSPAEEGGGGKIRILQAGVLDGVDAALMVHPAGFDAVERVNPARVGLEVRFRGRAAHAAAAPDQGRNALDGATLLLVSIGLLRQQIRADARVHAIVTSGGDAVNVIPEEATVRIFLRSPDSDYLTQRLRPALEDCCTGSALATGTAVEIFESSPAYSSVRTNRVLADMARRTWSAIGRDPAGRGAQGGSSGSTDMGNVSEIIPSIHPYVCVVPSGVLHSREFAAAAASPDGDRAVIDGATALATMTCNLLAHPELLEEAWRAHEPSDPHPDRFHPSEKRLA